MKIDVNENDYKILREAIRFYAVITGNVILVNKPNISNEEIVNELNKSALLTQEITTLMSQIYRTEIRKSMFGWTNYEEFDEIYDEQ